MNFGRGQPSDSLVGGRGYTILELLSVMATVSGVLIMMFVSLEGRMQALSWSSAALQSRHLATRSQFVGLPSGFTTTLNAGKVEVTVLRDSSGVGAVHFSAPTGVLPAWAVRSAGGGLTVFSQPANTIRAQIDKKILYEE